MHRTLLLATVTFFSSSIYSQVDSAVNKQTNKPYNLFHPVPKAKMKEMQMDRPDVTENAYTVEPGHFQMESDLYKYIRNTTNEVINEMHNFNVGNYKLGLSKRSDIQIVVPTYILNTIREKNTDKIIDRASGFDDITLRFKYNIFGYSGGKAALSVLPFLSFPTSSITNNGVQSGIVFPFALEINDHLNFGTQIEVDMVRDDEKNYHPDFLYSFTFGKPLGSKLNMFAEGVLTYTPYLTATDIFANSGIIFSVTENFNIDAGVNYGIKKETDKIFFVGFSFRL